MKLTGNIRRNQNGIDLAIVNNDVWHKISQPGLVKLVEHFYNYLLSGSESPTQYAGRNYTKRIISGQNGVTTSVAIETGLANITLYKNTRKDNAMPSDKVTFNIEFQSQESGEQVSQEEYSE